MARRLRILIADGGNTGSRAAGVVRRTLLCALCMWLPAAGVAAAPTAIRIAVLEYGTVNWELDVIKRHGLDREQGVDVQIAGFASKQATLVALQADSVEASVSDWLWVSRQRNQGGDFTFLPYSTLAGALVVPGDSPIRDLRDLRGMRVGIAGGPIDKSWLLLRALASKRYRIDLDREVEKVFAAPPLLNSQIEAGRIDAVINFWHYVARLEARGMRGVITIAEVARALGITTPVPIIGYVFRERWLREHSDAARGFLRASRRAKQIMLESDEEWERLRPLLRADSEATLAALRDGFRAGIPQRWGDAERRDAAKLFAVLSEVGGPRLVGDQPSLAPGTFWDGARF